MKERKPLTVKDLFRACEKAIRDGYDDVVVWFDTEARHYHWHYTTIDGVFHEEIDERKQFSMVDHSAPHNDCESHSNATLQTRLVAEKEHITDLEAKLKIATEALEYYSHSDHYEERVTLSGTRQPGVLTEGGAKARDALAKIKE